MLMIQAYTFPRMLLIPAIVALLLAAWPSAIAGADDAAQSESANGDAAERDASADEGSDDEDRPSSLDDLLGIDDEELDRSADDAARRDSEEDLQRRLTEREIADAFTEAVEKMNLSARLLDEDFDTGLGTQRIQEDIIAKLEQLIEQARNQQMSPSQCEGGEQSSDPQQDPGQQQEQQAQPRGETAEQRDGEEGEEAMPPGFQQDDEIATDIAETREEWGALPDRVRDMLLQGREERFSSLYEQFTREYYRRLAED